MSTSPEINEYNYENNVSFSKTIPFLQTSWDSVSSGVLKACPRKYYYSVVMGWQPKGENIHLSFGIHYHSALEEYDKAMAKGATKEDAMRSVVKYIQAIGTRDEDGNWQSWDTDKAHKDYKLKNKATLMRACQWYTDHFEVDPAKTLILSNGKPAVELSFSLGLHKAAVDGKEFLYCGHMDKMVEFGNEYFVLDRKTTKTTLGQYHHVQFNPNTQITGYIFAAQAVTKKAARGAIIDSCQLMVGGARFGRSLTYRTQAQLNEWLQGMFAMFRQAEIYAQEESYPMNETACSMYGGCPYREICSQDESVRDLHLNSKFKRKRWDPMISRI